MASARILMTGHGLKSMAILDGGQLVGLLTSEGLASAPEDAHIADRMEKPALVVEASTPVRRVAELFVETGIERAPVMSGTSFLGMVTSTMLLRELGRSWDPLTSLSWSDRLREWGVENLREGREIVVLFVDLDNFGAYNKRYGHVIGDNVLRKVVDLLKSACEGHNCILVRYGGDEFAIGMTGTDAEGKHLVEILRRRSNEILVDGVPEPVGFSVGMAGGKRSKERENVHYAATMDNLINLASRDCIAQKQSKPRPVVVADDAPSHTEQQAARKEAPVATAKPTARILSVYAEENSPTSQVVVSVDNGVVSGVSARSGRSVLESVAVATCKALERAYPGSALEIENVNLSEGPEGQRLVTVSGNIDKGKGPVTVGGVHEVERDLYTGVAEATLQAFSVL
jgi:diguanylate cyclase (GGDEF)-like protein